MPTEPPPSYETALTQPPNQAAARPGVSVTSPQGQTRSASSDQAAGTAPLARTTANESLASVSTDGGLGAEDLIGEEGRRSLDDERRDLPEGWVRCFDAKTEHHFYVDEATKRSTWLHPYDDPEFLRTLPDTHPANPNSQQGQAVRKRTEDERLMMEKMRERDKSTSKGGMTGSTGAATGGGGGGGGGGGDGDRNWFQKKKDELIGTKEERQMAKEEKRKAKEEQRKKMRKMQEEYMERRRELAQQQLDDPDIRRYYASDPFRYPAPSMAFSRRGGLYSSPYGYGYPGGYGRRYGYGGMGGMGMGLPLSGGLAGGFLLGDAMSGGFGGGGGGVGGGCGGGGGGGCGGGGGGM